ncbi:MAG: ABC transporter substrate-binding protein, partial [Pseudomonadota bacterium]
DRVVLEAYPDYWGGAPDWDRVTFLPITRPASRIAALLSGTVDVINDVPTTDVETLSQNGNVALWQGVSDRLIYLHLDTGRTITPMITANDGSEIENPLQDQRVREALSIAIDREALAENVMEGLAIPAGQLVPDGMVGASEIIRVPRYDPERAIELLAEAGYPDGFEIKLHGPSDRYINDGEILLAIAQMFSRIGLKTTVDVMPAAVYFGRATASEFSVMLVGWSANTGEASLPIRTLIATPDPERGWGAANRGNYSNPELDALLAGAEREIDEIERGLILADAMEIAMSDVAVIPIQFQINIWGTRSGLEYVSRADELTLATGVVPIY